VKNCEMAAAATMAMDIESSMVIRRASRFSSASLKIGQPPIARATIPITLAGRSGSQSRNHTAAAASATTAMRAASTQSNSCSWSSCSSAGGLESESHSLL
jgi:hypothetical protein